MAPGSLSGTCDLLRDGVHDVHSLVSLKCSSCCEFDVGSKARGQGMDSTG